MDRYNLSYEKSVLDDILNMVSSSVGSLTNANKITNTFKSERQMSIGATTVSRYLDYFIDAFLLYKVQRYDVKGRNLRLATKISGSRK